MNYMTKDVFTPNLARYDLSELDSNLFKLDDAIYKRTDGEFKSSRNRAICYSVFTKAAAPKDGPICLVYLTGNKGDRRSALFLRPHFLPNDIDIACFDYNGLGHSEREPLSYSIYERRDLMLLVN